MEYLFELHQNTPRQGPGNVEATKLAYSKLENIKMCNSYSEVAKGNLLGIVGSSGYLEISANQANASNLLNAEIADKVIVKVFKA